ncbi:GNAT family N-acetyltransferase [Paracoccus limosus]|uniref:GNAT family N-acetyltransferase n=1 Tax=Paracoccus limosus TaxID=913252 RepID=A0A844H1G4_9RHOB|nr:GNAT family N-acetyltransferase [Paracoccus limosus]MTH33855.1 GNAT family N-acetyltransferase [Paracoccus limosus]
MIIEETQDIAACRAIRHAVFVIEQNVPEDEEWDDLDEQAVHLLARTAEGTALGTARLIRRGETGKITRVAVLKEARGTGLGAGLIRAAIRQFATTPGITRLQLGAQNHAIPFYEKLGFTAYGPEYMDGGILHHDMERAL